MYQQILDAEQLKRSPHWGAVRNAHLKKQPTCQLCGAKTLLNVHHVRPFHLFPHLELEPTNFITLCEGLSVNCHLLIGHCMNWSCYNPNVVRDAKRLHEKIIKRLKAA